MKSFLRKILHCFGRLTVPLHRPLNRRYRQYLASCLEPHFAELHLRLDSLVREQDRLLTLIENLQANGLPGAASDWREAG